MLETIMGRQVIFYIVGIAAAAGIVARLAVGISWKRVVKAAANMGKSNHSLMRLVRAKFEHACMVSTKVHNIPTFVEKYLYEYKILGMRLHTWRNIEKISIWICAILCAAGAAADYGRTMEMEGVFSYAATGIIVTAVLLLLYFSMDEKYQMDAARMYMVDFLENTYAHRYEKQNQKEIQVTVQKAEPMITPDDTSEEQPQKPEAVAAASPSVQGVKTAETTQNVHQAKTLGNLDEEKRLDPEKEAKIRQILQEFLTI